MSSRSGQGKDSRQVLIHHDQISNAMPILSEEHRRTHLGNYWTFSYITSPIAPFASKDIAIYTDGSLANFPLNTYMHCRFRAASNLLDALLVELYEGASWTPGDDNQTGRNHNRVQGELYGGTFVTPFEPAGVVGAVGTRIMAEVVPATKMLRTREWILEDTGDLAGPYMLRVTNLAASGATLGIHVEYYLATHLTVNPL